MMGYYGVSAVPMMLLAGVIWILLLVGAGFLLYVLVTGWQRGQQRSGPGPDDPLAVLRIRYARGEITREEFQRMHRDLSGRDGEGG